MPGDQRVNASVLPVFEVFLFSFFLQMGYSPPVSSLYNFRYELKKLPTLMSLLW